MKIFTTKIIAASAAILFIACGDAKAPSNSNTSSITITDQQVVHQINSTQMLEIVNGKTITILDVRTPEEYNEGHIPGAVLANVNDPSFEETINGMEKDNSVVVYCRSGNRSGKAADLMEQARFTNIMDYDGGWSAWSQGGYPIEK